MPHIDELIGVATVASAGLFASIALQPAVIGDESVAAVQPVASVVAADPSHAPGAQVEPREVLVRRSSSGGPAATDAMAAPSAPAREARQPDA